MLKTGRSVVSESCLLLRCDCSRVIGKILASIRTSSSLTTLTQDHRCMGTGRAHCTPATRPGCGAAAEPRTCMAAAVLCSAACPRWLSVILSPADRGSGTPHGRSYAFSWRSQDTRSGEVSVSVLWPPSSSGDGNHNACSLLPSYCISYGSFATSTIHLAVYRGTWRQQRLGPQHCVGGQHDSAAAAGAWSGGCAAAPAAKCRRSGGGCQGGVDAARRRTACQCVIPGTGGSRA